MYRLPDHPIIQNMERTGTPDGKKPSYPVCPNCHQTCERVYKDKGGDILGCDNCVTEMDAYDVPACYPDENI